MQQVVVGPWSRVQNHETKMAVARLACRSEVLYEYCTSTLVPVCTVQYVAVPYKIIFRRLSIYCTGT